MEHNPSLNLNSKIVHMTCGNVAISIIETMKAATRLTLTGASRGLSMLQWDFAGT